MVAAGCHGLRIGPDFLIIILTHDINPHKNIILAICIYSINVNVFFNPSTAQMSIPAVQAYTLFYLAQTAS